MEEIQFKHLEHFLKAPSKEVVTQQCQQAFIHRNSKHVPSAVLQSLAEALSVNSEESREVFGALSGLIQRALFLSASSDNGQTTGQLFPSDFHKNLKDLLSKIIADNLSEWRNQSINSMVSLPRLVDFDWRVDIKTSADTMSRMSVPTCILQLQIDESRSSTSSLFGGVNCTSVELSKETLDTMLDGLGKIRHQLSSVADAPSHHEQ